MKTISSYPSIWKGLLFIPFVILLLGMESSLIPMKPKEIQSPFSPKDAYGISMCAPLISIGKENASPTVPVAPDLNIKWEANFPITTASEEAQKFFNQGLFFVYAFNHAEAERSFREAIRQDSTCAMCHWGVGLSLGPNINRPMPEEQNEAAFQSSQRALQLSTGVSQKEKALILALSKRYEANFSTDRSALDLNFANAMQEVAEAFGEDLDILTLCAESLMDLMPWNYWEEDGSPRPETQKAHVLLEKVMERDPTHPGANHYYIHTVEAIYPEKAIGAADRLRDLDYGAGHLVHMPSHIYIRVGKYREAANANVRAIEVDEQYITQCNVQGFYPLVYYPHNLHFLWFASTMEGRKELATETSLKLASKIPDELAIQIPLLQTFKVIPLFSKVRFAQWEEILESPKPIEELKYSQLIWHYARGIAYARKGELELAKAESKALEDLMNDEEVQAQNIPLFPTIPLSQIAHQIVKAEIAGAQGKQKEEIQHFQEAVSLQDQLPYMEPPFFYYPIRQSLGASLLRAGEAERAEEVYKQELTQFPNNGWSLYGLYESQKQQGKEGEAKISFKEFEKAWTRAEIRLKGSVL